MGLLERSGRANLIKAIGYSRVLIRIMKIILDLTLRNNCFARRKAVLESPRLRRLVMERLGGAPALLRWRRKETWNKARLAVIASGEYRPVREPHRPPARTPRQSPPERMVQIERLAQNILPENPSPPAAGPAKFRLPVLQNLRYVRRPRIITKHRAKPQKRFPAVVLWPHELDGQYVPDFQSRARVPDPGGYAAYRPAAAPDRPGQSAIFAPP